MTHEPECPHPWDDYPSYCQCDLIRRVREDEAAKYGSLRTMHDAIAKARAAALRDAAQAVDATYTVSNVTLDADFKRAAVAAIEALSMTPAVDSNETRSGGE